MYWFEAGRSNGRMNTQIIKWIWIISFLLAIFFRSINPLSDPPPDLSWSGGYYADEGFWVHDARNWVIWGDYGTDDWHDRFVSPLIHPWTIFLFKAIKPGLLAVRISALSFSFATVIIFILLVRVYQWGWLAFLFSAVCPVFVAYQRIALLETAAVVGSIVTAYCWCRAASARVYFWYGAAGFFAALTYITKGTQIYLLFTLLAASYWLDGFNSFSHKKNITQVLGFLSVIIPWFVVIYLPEREILIRYQQFYLSQHEHSLISMIKNVILQPFFIYFNRMPLILCTGWLLLIEIPFMRSFARRSKEIPGIVLFSYVWFVSGFLFLSPLTYRPVRYYIPLIIPLILIGSWRWIGMTDLLRGSRSFDKKFPMKVGSSGRNFISSSWMMIPVIANAIPLLDQLFTGGKWLGYASLPGFSTDGAIMVIVIGIFLAAVSILPGRISYRIWIIITIICVGMDVGRLLNWQFHRTYHIVQASRELNTLLPSGSVIAGQWAPELCLETTHRAIPLWKGFVNDENPFEKHNITHILSWEYPLGNELVLQKQWFPEVMENATYITTFQIKNSPVILWQVKELDEIDAR